SYALGASFTPRPGGLCAREAGRDAARPRQPRRGLLQPKREPALHGARDEREEGGQRANPSRRGMHSASRQCITAAQGGAHRWLGIHTDSAYAIGVLSKRWKAKANLALIERVRERLAKRPATLLVHVRGHAGIELNERADELAREAVRTGRSRSERVG